FQQTFTFDEGVLLDTNETNIIPARVSSVNTHNDFRPTVAEGEEAERILEKIQKLSDRLN
ncbi:MAG: CapA family protein, partial [Alphaproteobacteria bacterium]|nr:CapA family protein [Alphaproteobacteria bacterium]